MTTNMKKSPKMSAVMSGVVVPRANERAVRGTEPQRLANRTNVLVWRKCPTLRMNDRRRALAQRKGDM
jgi:hypothetical protein